MIIDHVQTPKRRPPALVATTTTPASTGGREKKKKKKERGGATDTLSPSEDVGPFTYTSKWNSRVSAEKEEESRVLKVNDRTC